MFRRALVPLDGSRLAEAVLPVAVWCADCLKVTITLLHVIEQGAPPQVHGERHLTRPGEAAAYLKTVAETTFGPRAPVDVHVHATPTARVAQSIVDHQEELTPDLVVLCSHGRGGVRDLLFGTIAQQVIAAGTIPVLIVRARRVHAPTPFHCRKLLVPTDGEPRHEQALAAARDIAKAAAASILLLSVVPTRATVRGRSLTSARMMPGTTQAALDMTAENLRAHLDDLVTGLMREGVQASAEVQRGDPAEHIVETAQETGADLIVLATHGRAGATAFWTGSVAPAVFARTMVPVLLVPV